MAEYYNFKLDDYLNNAYAFYMLYQSKGFEKVKEQFKLAQSLTEHFKNDLFEFDKYFKLAENLVNRIKTSKSEEEFKFNMDLVSLFKDGKKIF